jgi:hydroxymethyl cephem carbamoyltransferase
MDILAYKPGHDGHIAYLDGTKLVFSIEAEKDSWTRHEGITPSLHLRGLQYLKRVPEVVSISGWAKNFHPIQGAIEGGYFGEGVDTIVDREQSFLNRTIRFFSSSHERSHLLCSYGMSPFEQGEPCYALVWEGHIGAFYYIDERVSIRKIGSVLDNPGNKYSFLYSLADPTFSSRRGYFRPEDAGKMMALAGYGGTAQPTVQEKELIEILIGDRSSPLALDKAAFRNSPFFNIGVESRSFKDLSKNFSHALFETFASFARLHLRERFPLLISGGCGLNCDWNSAWKQTGLFRDVFVPPCPNDVGSAIGTAVDAMRHYTGKAKLDWTVYAGEVFEMDKVDLCGIERKRLDLAEVAKLLASGKVIAWVQGRYEIGPRALGNRSIFATPFARESHDRVNSIKQRETFRPIAPICLEADIGSYFEHHGPSPHMLYFQRVRSAALPAVTHVDGTARMQSVNSEQNPKAHALLSAFKRETGHGVLCNTSLNFKGAGFINRLSDLVRYARERGLDAFVVGDSLYKMLPTGD